MARLTRLVAMLCLVLAGPAWAQTPPKPVQLVPSFAPVTPAKPKALPIVQPPKNAHAQKPPQPAPAPPVVEAVKPAETPKPSESGLPLPRWASLRSDEVNLRSGPGTRYPVEWVYKRRDLPVEIQREFEVWRLVQDQDGVKGWVHQATLTGRRSFVVLPGADRVLRHAAADDAAPVAVLKPGVVGRIRSCEAGRDWCEMQVGEYRGWLKRSDVWGTYPGEAVN